MSDNTRKRLGAAALIVAWACGSWLTFSIPGNVPWFIVPLLGIFFGIILLLLTLLLVYLVCMVLGFDLGD
ncbi:hypothetical protein [Flavobacterium sp.]|jgi:hypothetical protein|uniref:hypothetical protein n=1 Tax=Flavobacterium sp. TaxID=239 RepID=UPI0037BE3658